MRVLSRCALHLFMLGVVLICLGHIDALNFRLHQSSSPSRIGKSFSQQRQRRQRQRCDHNCKNRRHGRCFENAQFPRRSSSDSPSVLFSSTRGGDSSDDTLHRNEYQSAEAALDSDGTLHLSTIQLEGSDSKTVQQESGEVEEQDGDVENDQLLSLESLFDKYRNVPAENIPDAIQQRIESEVLARAPSANEVRLRMLGLTPLTIAGFALAAVIITLNYVLGTGWASELLLRQTATSTSSLSDGGGRSIKKSADDESGVDSHGEGRQPSDAELQDFMKKVDKESDLGRALNMRLQQ